MYEEIFTEHWYKPMERCALIEREEERELHSCAGFHCDREALVEINGDWWCPDCALEVEKYNEQ